MDGLAFTRDPYEVVLGEANTKPAIGDPVSEGTTILCSSASDLPNDWENGMDMVITDPPFGEIMTYADMSDFFYVWLRLGLAGVYPDLFAARFAPQIQEAISNPYRHPDTEKREKGSLSAADEFYSQVLIACWRESSRILNPR